MPAQRCSSPKERGGGDPGAARGRALGPGREKLCQSGLESRERGGTERKGREGAPPLSSCPERSPEATTGGGPEARRARVAGVQCQAAALGERAILRPERTSGRATRQGALWRQRQEDRSQPGSRAQRFLEPEPRRSPGGERAQLRGTACAGEGIDCHAHVAAQLRSARQPSNLRAQRSGGRRPCRAKTFATLAGSRMSSSSEECRSPVGLDCCSCCLDLANRSGLEEGPLGCNNNLGSPFQQLREQLVCENLNADKLSRIMRQDSLEPVVRDPCYLLNQGICNRNIDQTLLSILLFFHRWVGRGGGRWALLLLLLRITLLQGKTQGLSPKQGGSSC